MKRRITYGVTERGISIGEAHHNAKLTDLQVEWVRDLYEEGFVSYKVLADAFGVSKDCVKSICNFRRRATTAAEYRTRVVEVEGSATWGSRPDWQENWVDDLV